MIKQSNMPLMKNKWLPITSHKSQQESPTCMNKESCIEISNLKISSWSKDASKQQTLDGPFVRINPEKPFAALQTTSLLKFATANTITTKSMSGALECSCMNSSQDSLPSPIKAPNITTSPKQPFQKKFQSSEKTCSNRCSKSTPSNASLPARSQNINGSESTQTNANTSKTLNSKNSPKSSTEFFNDIYPYHHSKLLQFEIELIITIMPKLFVEYLDG